MICEQPTTPLTLSSRVLCSAAVAARRPAVTAVALLAFAWAFLGGSSHAEDADRYRPYMHWRSGEWDAIWDVHDMWGLAVGANLDRHWGVELVVDGYEKFLVSPQGDDMAEQSAISFMPQVRLRQPFFKDRLVPYLLAGAGVSFLQFNDRKSPAYGVDLEAEGWRAAVTGGIGVEYFLADNITFGFEGKYLWIDELDTKVGGVPGTLDMSTFLLTMGLRVYFDENRPQPLADAPGSSRGSRFYFGVRTGGSYILDGQWGDGIELAPESGSWGGSINQHYGLTLGVNLNRNWAIELAGDGGENNILVDGYRSVAEYASVALIPQVRYRWPVGRGRWVPYATAGVGGMYSEFNDAKPQSVGFKIKADGITPAVRAGAGFEYFVTHNLSFGAEANYLYSWDHQISLGDRPEQTGDLSWFQALVMFRVYLFDL